MPSTDAAGPNADQVAYWNASAGPIWVAMQDVLDAQLRDLGLAAVETLAPQAGEGFIDIGCGCGDTSLELARRVGASGSVLGVDISGPMLEVARGRAATHGLSQATFTQADAQTHTLPPVDGAFSRFGVMFFADPPAAFANVRRAFRPGGRLAFVCWRALGENPWMTIPFMAAASLLPQQAPPPPDAPGPFAFADRDRVHRILRTAGFTDISIEPHDRKIGWGDPDTGVRAALNLGPLGAALRESPQLVDPVRAAVRQALAAHTGPDREVRLDSASWIVLAR
jgi:SAM-dependent methyltransferase